MSVFYIREAVLNDDQFAKLTMREMLDVNIHCMRESLFKYFPNTKRDVNGVIRNFSIEALKNNTVYLANPREFDDPYDCNVFMDSVYYSLQRIKYYALLCGINVKDDWDYAETARSLARRVVDHLSAGNKLSSLFQLNTENELVKVHQEHFLLTLELELRSPNTSGESYHTAFNKVITYEYNEMQKSADRFRVACFAQTPYSMLMWAHYANCHKGFCM